MARPSLYTDEQKAAVFAELTATDGNVKATARETGVPEQTVRDWKKKWQRQGGVPATVEGVLPAVVEVKAEQLLTLFSKAVTVLSTKLDGDTDSIKVGELNAVIGTLFDKIRLLQGLATQRTETVHTGPTPEEFGAALRDYLEQAVSAQEIREAEIVDAEFEEQAPLALPVSVGEALFDPS